MATISDFRSERIKLFFTYKLPRYFLPSLESIGFSVQEDKCKIDFQDGKHGGHFRLPIGMILAIFYIYKLLRYSLPSFQTVGLFVQEKKKIDFQDGHSGHFGFPMERFQLFFICVYLSQMTIRFRRKRANRFSRWLP